MIDLETSFGHADFEKMLHLEDSLQTVTSSANWCLRLMCNFLFHPIGNEHERDVIEARPRAVQSALCGHRAVLPGAGSELRQAVRQRPG